MGKWVLGGYSRTTTECFLVEWPHDKRHHHTLVRLIKDRFVPGATILSMATLTLISTTSRNLWIQPQECTKIPVRVCGSVLNATRGMDRC